MKFRNTKNGTVIDVKSPISGEHWEPLDVGAAPDEAEEKPKPKKAPAKKKKT